MKVSCYYCRRTLPKTAPRIFNGQWCCEDCAYLIDHPDAKRIAKTPRPNPLRPQAEQLFDD